MPQFSPLYILYIFTWTFLFFSIALYLVTTIFKPIILRLNLIRNVLTFNVF